MAVLIFSGLALVVTGASRPGLAVTPQSRVLNVGIVNLQVVTFNPMKITLVDEFIVIYNTMSTLLTYDKSYTPHPDLAKSWTVSPNGTVWTFHLVHDAYFTDPTNPADHSHQVTAADVVYTYNLQAANSASILNAYTQQIASITALDTYTVQIVTKAPYAAMYSTLSAIPIMPQYWWSAQSNPINAKPKFPIGSGVMYYNYNLSGANPSSFMVLSRNPNYFGQYDYCQFARPNDVYFLSYADPTSMVTDFTTGANNLNAMMGLDPLSYNSTALKNFAPAVRQQVDEGFVGEFSINAMTNAERQMLANEGLSQFTQGSPSNNQILATNPTVRLAIAMSINKPALVADALLGLGNVADTLVPDSNPWHYAIPGSMTYQFNPTAARQMLYNSGWKYDSSGNNATATTYPLYQKGATNGTVYWPLSFRFYTLNTEPNWATAAADIVGWLHQTGIETTDRLGNPSPGYGLYSINQMSGYWFSGDYDMWLWDWVFSPASDPSTDVLQVETTGAIGPTSDNFYSNATYDALYNQSLVTLDHSARQSIIDRMQMMIYNYTSYILPYYQLELFAYRNDAPSASGVAWTGWGNWSQNVGLAPDSDLPNLWMQVYPASQAPPTVQSLSPASTYTGLPANFTATATDPENDITSYTWDFGDGTATQTSSSGTASHIYATAGNYTVTVAVTDGEWTSCDSAAATIVQNPGGTVNLPPTLSAFYGNASATHPGMPVVFTLNASDSEGDLLYATWTWGDGTPNGISFVNASAANEQTVTVTKTHAFAAVGNYTVKVEVTDNQTSPGLSHTLNDTYLVTVTKQSSGGTTPPPSGGTTPQGNPLLDYGIPILIVAVIVIAIAAVLMRRRKEAKEDQEEGQTPKQGPPPPS